MPQPRAEAVFKKGALGDDVTAKSVHIQLIPGDQLLEPITTVATCSSIRLQVSPVPKPWHRIHALSLRTFNNPQDRLQYKLKMKHTVWDVLRQFLKPV
jgi:hypothetical protein